MLDFAGSSSSVCGDSQFIDENHFTQTNLERTELKMDPLPYTYPSSNVRSLYKNIQIAIDAAECQKSSDVRPSIIEKLWVDVAYETSCFSYETKEFELLNSIENDPVIDGFTHKGETILGKLLHEKYGDVRFHLERLLFGDENVKIRSSVLLLLGRLNPIDADWRAYIIKKALTFEDIEMRDAAIQAAELWEDFEMLDVLRRHEELVPWLKDYKERVIEDLENS